MKREHLFVLGGAAILGGGYALSALLRAPATDATTPVCDTAPPGPQPAVPAGWSIYRGTPSGTATAAARAALGTPFGSASTFVDDDGSMLGVVVMWHCHDPSSGMTPVGWHKGATLFQIA